MSWGLREAKCLYCGREFVQKQVGHCYCSRKCRKLGRNSRRKRQKASLQKGLRY